MTTQPENIVIEHLRHIHRKVDSIEHSVNNLTLRVNSLEQSVGLLHVDMAGVNWRLDQFDLRLHKIEDRLDLVD
jgi:hypothetical protein